jgi:hypothetical protein
VRKKRERTRGGRAWDKSRKGGSEGTKKGREFEKDRERKTDKAGRNGQSERERVEVVRRKRRREEGREVGSRKGTYR